MILVAIMALVSYAFDNVALRKMSFFESKKQKNFPKLFDRFLFYKYPFLEVPTLSQLPVTRIVPH